MFIHSFWVVSLLENLFPAYTEYVSANSWVLLWLFHNAATVVRVTYLKLSL